MPARLFITGVSGLLGLNAAAMLRDRFSVSGCYHEHPVHLGEVAAEPLDVRDPAAVARHLSALRPDVVLHTAGLTNVDACERRPADAHDLNVAATENVAAAAQAIGARLVHISTDHLFNGRAPMRLEPDPPSPLNEYARTKLAAEHAAVRCEGALIVRTNFYGWGPPGRMSFSDWILASLAGGAPVRMFTDVFFTPLLVNDLVDAIAALIDRRATGVFHVAGAQRLSKFDFGRRVAHAFGYDPARIVPWSVHDARLSAVRPVDMSLDVHKASAVLGDALPDVDSGLDRLRRLEASGWRDRLAEAMRAAAEPTRFPA